MIANRLPTTQGGTVLGHALTASGGVESEFTITRDGDKFLQSVQVLLNVTTTMFYCVHSLVTGSVSLKNITLEHGTLVVCGPRSRELLFKITDADLSNDGFPWLTSQRITVAGVSFTGFACQLCGGTWLELHHPIDQQVHLFDSIVEVGKEFGLRHLVCTPWNQCDSKNHTACGVPI
jgi:dimethylglycine dehydrogenase